MAKKELLVTYLQEIFEFSDKSRGNIKKKINGKLPTKKYEKFFLSLSENDLKNILDFLNQKNNGVTLKLKRDPVGNVNSNTKITETVYESKSYGNLQFNITYPRNKLAEINKRIASQYNIEKVKNMFEEIGHDKYDEEMTGKFLRQHQFKCIDAFKSFYSGSTSIALKNEIEYLQKNNLHNTIVIDYEKVAFHLYGITQIIYACMTEFFPDLDTLSLTSIDEAYLRCKKYIRNHYFGLLDSHTTYAPYTSNMPEQYFFDYYNNELLNAIKKRS
ncbi:hypothetical protein [Sulfuricurvum sp.]|jgi:uncharacterized protein involved in tolerance to divalent cations|uniref:hypothetical protein n=1 Tax=Sulfuricurvum sp. TaxID=2025608 RepID=UPI0026311D20|nr:hypothetical protein [Sulfuricurvum sp.]MDD4950515.1 hypothetical protein [Sulfuricurvum sp.]